MSVQAQNPDTLDFSPIRNHHEQAVYRAVIEIAPHFPGLGHRPELLVDVACVALNRLPPRYIRHQVDLAFHMTEKERQDSEQLILDTVVYAFEFVQARHAMRARR